MPAARPSALFIERRRANLMIRLVGDVDTQEYSMFSAVPSLRGNTVVLSSVGALTSQDLPQAVNQAVRQALDALPGPPPPGHRVWLALSGLGRPGSGSRTWPQRLAEDLGVEVLAPQGPLSLIPGGMLFVGGSAGTSGWRSFRRGDTSRPWGARHPQPHWEALLPPQPVSAAGLTVEAIPAGLLVLADDAPSAPPMDRAYAVAVHPHQPRLVLGRLGEPGTTPARVAALISTFPPTLAAALELVPHTPSVARTQWFAELADRLGRDVRAADGMPLYGRDGRVHVVAHNVQGEQLSEQPVAIRRFRPPGAGNPAGDVPEAPRPPHGTPPPEPPGTTRSGMPSVRHRSTNVEQVEFERQAEPHFARALASVTATAGVEPHGAGGAKADLVAVHLYLQAGELGAVAMNSALRTGAGQPPSPAHLACLMSGLRRLPVHRGVVYRSVRLPDTRRIADDFTQGAVVSEPGFLSTTTAADLTIPGGTLDVLIWSRSGRGTHALAVDGLVDEIVFPARTRFKILAVDVETDMPALLVRELHPDDLPASRRLDSTDEAVLSKLGRALSRRRGTPQRLLEVPDQIDRLSPPLATPGRGPAEPSARGPEPGDPSPRDPATTWSMPVQHAVALPDVFIAQTAPPVFPETGPAAD